MIILPFEDDMDIDLFLINHKRLLNARNYFIELRYWELQYIQEEFLDEIDWIERYYKQMYSECYRLIGRD